MRLARMKATATGAEHRVAFDIGTDSYRIERGDKMFKSDIWVPITEWIRVGEKADLYKVTFKKPWVTFNVNGTVEGVNGSVYLKNAKDRKVRARVMSATGNVAIQGRRRSGKGSHPPGRTDLVIEIVLEDNPQDRRDHQAEFHSQSRESFPLTLLMVILIK